MASLNDYQVGNIVKCKIDIQNFNNEDIVKIVEIDENTGCRIQLQKTEKSIIVQRHELNPIYLGRENLKKLGFEVSNNIWSNEVLKLISKVKYIFGKNKEIIAIQNNGGYEVVSIDENRILKDGIITLHELQNVYTEHYPNCPLNTNSFYN